MCFLMLMVRDETSSCRPTPPPAGGAWGPGGPRPAASGPVVRAGVGRGFTARRLVGDDGGSLGLAGVAAAHGRTGPGGGTLARAALSRARAGARSARGHGPWTAALLLGVPVGIYALLAVYPIAQELLVSLFRWSIMPDRASVFVGLANYAALARDPVVPTATFVTALYVVATVPAQIVLGLLAAWATFRRARLAWLLVVVCALPLAVPWSSATSLFLALFSQTGPVNALLQAFGIAPVLWFQSQGTALAVVVLVGIWKGFPMGYLLLLAALTSAPPDVYEAGRVDGARGLAYWRHVVLPSIRTMLVFVLAFEVMRAAQVFDPVALLTQGGPMGSTETLAYYAYQQAFQDFNFGYGAAVGAVTAIGLVVVAVAFVAYMRRPPLRGDPPVLSAQADDRDAARATARRDDAGSLPPGPARALVPALGTTAFALFVLALVAPIVVSALGASSLDAYVQSWASVARAFWNSAAVSVAGVAGTLILAIPPAYALARLPLRGRELLFAAVLASMAIPGPLLLLPQYQEMASLGLVNTRLALVLLYVAQSFPLAVVLLRGTFQAVPAELEEAMRVDGVSLVGRIARLVLPLSRAGLVAVSLFAFVAMWSELPLAATIIDSPGLNTLPVVVALGQGSVGSLYASWLSLLPPVVVLVALQRWFRPGTLAGAVL